MEEFPEYRLFLYKAFFEEIFSLQLKKYINIFYRNSKIFYNILFHKILFSLNNVLIFPNIKIKFLPVNFSLTNNSSY
jgi:hypothetical protein